MPRFQVTCLGLNENAVGIGKVLIETFIPKFKWLEV